MPSPDPRSRVLASLRRHGWNTTSFQVLERGFSYWFDPEADACVAYVDTGSAWVAAGAPIAAPADVIPAAGRFIEAARAGRRRPCFFAVEARLAEAELVSSMPIGEQPSWDPAQWDGVVRAARSLREQLRRARAKGVTVRALSPDEIAAATSPVRPQVEDLVARWVASRKMAPMGFIVDVQPFDFAAERRWFVAEREGHIVGLLVAVPVYQRNGWLFEDVLRAEDSPNGTTEALIDTAMRALAAEESRYVTLGLAPLSGEVSPWLRFVRACARALYDFDGVHRFKAKLRPDAWVPIHLAWPRDASGNVALVDALSAFTMRAQRGHERASFVRFGMETLAHAPALGVRVLALLLVPWTIALAVVPTARYFPSRTVQLGWVAWDIVLAASMLVLAARWRPNLARILAIGTSLDAALTLLEVVTDAAPRMRGPFDAALLTVACLGPVLATSQLWGALVWRSREHA